MSDNECLLTSSLSTWIKLKKVGSSIAIHIVHKNEKVQRNKPFVNFQHATYQVLSIYFYLWWKH